jgi:diguanylate cyclase (GGDEF)-like protein
VAGTDPLTGLPNRHWLSERLQRGSGGSLVVIDIDGFRTVNEALGYDIGDHILVECAHRLNRTLDGGAVLTRIGDDEFGIVMPESADPVVWGSDAREALSLPIMIDGHPLTITASVGVAVAESDEATATELLQAADGAVERAKGRGGDRLEVFDPVILEQARRRSRIEQELRRGLQARHFAVHYQPQVSMTTGMISGVEALVRWEHPVDGSIHPGAFLEVAEQTGLIRELGALVLEKACVDAVALLERRRPNADERFTVSVNVSTVQLRDPSFARTVSVALAESGLPPDCLCLEITESAILGNSIRLESVLDRLRDLGVRFSIDDFGTGYSSLSYLQRLDLDELKIDRSFIVAMDEPQGRHIVAAICGIADALELETVAEGVDDEAVVASLRRWGCDVVQGFLYFRPEPLDSVLRAVKRDKPRRLPEPA